jgi:hypothetical protein
MKSIIRDALFRAKVARRARRIQTMRAARIAMILTNKIDQQMLSFGASHRVNRHRARTSLGSGAYRATNGRNLAQFPTPSSCRNLFFDK